ncbi:AaceriAER307Wp [[Ashbya] aceris (nom. inval.)]|nr:AaceriAER307Wp [[Ashbya] aceris (nom. inval.)]
MYDSATPAPLNLRYSYHAIFSDICKTRFNYLATRLLLTLSVVSGAAVTIMGRWDVTRWERLLVFPVKTLLVYFALLLVIITRKNYLHVQFLGYSNTITFVYGEFFSLKFVLYQITHIVSGLLISLALGGVLYDAKHSIPVLYQRINEWMLVPLIYTVQHLAFDLGRLSFNYGHHRHSCQTFILSRMRDSFIKCSVLTAATFVLHPVVYFLLTTKVSVGFLACIQSAVLAFITYQLWDLTNIAFNAYLSIGCLHKGKPISSLSSTPMETLVTGLNSKRMFTKLTAFQELSYRATSPDVQMRLPIYHTRYGNSHIWTNILRECLVTIQESNNNIAEFLKSLEQSKETFSSVKQMNFSPLSQDDVLFGNQPALATAAHAQAHLPGSEQRFNKDPLHSDAGAGAARYFPGQPARQFIQPAHSYNPPIFTQQPNMLHLVQDVANYLTKLLVSFFFPGQSTAYGSKRPLSFFELWTISKKRQAEKLIPLPSCYAECVIALMGMLINSLDEDPKGSVVSSVGEVLKIIERSVGSLGTFVEWELPSSSDAGPDAISVLYDLSINVFLEIVLKYNELLNDVYLDDDVVKLSQWVLQTCNE